MLDEKGFTDTEIRLDIHNRKRFAVATKKQSEQ